MQDVRVSLDTDQLLGAYYKSRLVADAMSMIQRKIFSDDDEEEERKLRREALISDIAKNRRAAGLPYSDDDYEDALNDDKPFKNYGHLAIFGKAISDKLPSLRHFDGSHSALKMLTPISKGSRYGRLAGTVGRIFG